MVMVGKVGGKPSEIVQIIIVQTSFFKMGVIVSRFSGKGSEPVLRELFMIFVMSGMGEGRP